MENALVLLIIVCFAFLIIFVSIKPPTPPHVIIQNTINQEDTRGRADNRYERRERDTPQPITNNYYITHSGDGLSRNALPTETDIHRILGISDYGRGQSSSYSHIGGMKELEETVSSMRRLGVSESAIRQLIHDYKRRTLMLDR